MSLVFFEYFDLKKARYYKLHKWSNFSILLTEFQTNWILTYKNSAGSKKTKKNPVLWVEENYVFISDINRVKSFPLVFLSRLVLG